MAVYYNMGTFALVCFAYDSLQSLVPQNMYVHTSQLHGYVCSAGKK